MASLESMFIFEVKVREIEKFTPFSSNFYAQCKFSDVFLTHLEDIDCLLKPLRYPIKAKRKPGSKNKKFKIKYETVEQGPSEKSVLFSCEIKTLMEVMKKNPIELVLWRRDLRQKIGVALIPWHMKFRQYLRDMLYIRHEEPESITMDYYAMDDLTSTCVARLNMTLTFCHVLDNIPILLRAASETNLTVYFAQLQTNPKTLRAFKVDKNDRDSPNILELNNEKYFDKIYASIGEPDQEYAKNDDNLNAVSINYEPQVSGDNNKESHDVKANDDHDNAAGQKATCSRYMETLLNLTRSDTELTKQEKVPKGVNLNISRSHMEIGQKFDRSNTYVVSYFTVHDKSSDPSPKLTSDESAHNPPSGHSSDSKSNKDDKKQQSAQSFDSKSQKGDKSPAPRTTSKTADIDNNKELKGDSDKYFFKACDDECPAKELADQTGMVVNLPKEAKDLIKMKKCKHITCDQRPQRPAPELPDDNILVDFKDILGPCCQKTEEVKALVTGKTLVSFDGVPCECTCECTFGFIKKTTYCEICGGFEAPGEDEKKGHPCPVFHKLVDMKKLKGYASSGSSGKSTSKFSKSNKSGSQKSSGSKSSGGKSGKFDKKSQAGEATETEGEKRKKGRKIDPRFIFHYGFTGIPALIGHGDCISPCTGSMDPVPKSMGWLWTADNVPGLKFRPGWRPGAIHKYVLMMLRKARNPDLVYQKKKRQGVKKKKNVKRPLLVVAKRDGEFTITMETMKVYPKPRAINQQPYEDKPVLTYTIGRTEEENRKREKRKTHELLNLQREQRMFIQDTFRNLCKEICGKTYEQAIGILPGGEDPTCPCFVVPPKEDLLNETICPCDEKESLPDTETDDDEWLLEFTPPNALYEANYRPPKIVQVDVSTQYTYLDYKVKCLDANGKEYPRYFKGPDGKTECTDLGGFWGPNHKWNEINYDGIIGADNKWCPMRFTGPNGEIVDIERDGKFTLMGVGTYIAGIDGYVDAAGIWKSYPRPKKIARTIRSPPKGGKADKDNFAKNIKPSTEPVILSCFGDTSPKRISDMGIVGHGYNKKLLVSALNALIAQGENITIPQPTSVPRLAPQSARKSRTTKNTDLIDHARCYHPPPSQKGVIIDKRGRKKYFKIDLESKKRGARHFNDNVVTNIRPATTFQTPMADVPSS